MDNRPQANLVSELLLGQEPTIELVTLSSAGVAVCQPTCSPDCGPCSPCNPDECHPDCSPYD